MYATLRVKEDLLHGLDERDFIVTLKSVAALNAEVLLVSPCEGVSATAWADLFDLGIPVR